MQWLTSLQSALAAGKQAFLLTGNTQDLYPKMYTTGPEFFDLAEMVSRTLSTPCLRFTHGLGFETSDEELQEALAIKPDAKSSDDPLEKARAQMQAAAGAKVPDADEVVATLRRLAAERTEPTSFIVPHIELFCPKGARESDGMALTLISLIDALAFRNGGHVLILTAASPTAVHERLVRADGPFERIVVDLPDRDERAHCFGMLIDAERHVAARKEELQTALHDYVAAHEARTAAELASTTAQLDAVRREASANPKVREVEALLAGEKNAYAEFLAVHDAEIARLEGELSLVAPHTPNAKEFLTLTVRSIVQITYAGGQTVRYVIHGGVKVDGKIGAVFADPETGVVFPKAGKPVCFFWDGARLRIVQHDGEGNMLQEQSRDASLIAEVPQVATLSAALEKARMERERSMSSNEVQVILNRIEVLEAELAQQYGAHKSQIDNLEAHINTVKAIDCTLQPAYQKLAAELAALQEVPASTWKSPRSAAELAGLTPCCTYRDIRGLCRALMREVQNPEESIVAHTSALIARRYGSYFTVKKPMYGFEGVAGYDHLKAYFRSVADTMRAQRYTEVPMGCLLMGPPGTGKTAIAEAFAAEAGVTLVTMKQIRDMFVGQSEARMEEALAALRSLAPVVVLRDEVDQEDGGRDGYSGDSGVSNRLRQMWMTFLSDPYIRGKVFVISCTNRPDLIDPAMMRSGRTDERIPLLMPDGAMRAELFAVMIRRNGISCSLVHFEAYAGLTDCNTGADIEVIVRRSYEFAKAAGRAEVVDDDLLAACLDFIPQVQQGGIARMVLAALRATSSRRWLPADHEAVRQRYEAQLAA